MKAKMISDEDGAKKGTIIDHPDAWKLVRLGVAEPADVECRKKAGMTPAKTEAAIAFQRKAKQGIQDAIDAGAEAAANQTITE